MNKENLKLSAAITINKTIIKNRIVVPPMADFGATNPDGLVDARHLRHYSEFAEGGAGLIIIEACTVCRVHENRNTIGLYDDVCIPGMHQLALAATKNGAVAIVQLLNAGLDYLAYHSIAEIPTEMFQQYKKEFVVAAHRCKKAGFHGVELHAAHGFYLDQIVETSQRTDGYGGAFECRVRILDELIREIKQQCGADFIVSVRFGNRSLDELVLTAKTIESAGGDLLDVSTGLGYYSRPLDFKYDAKVFAASLVKKNTSIPVICVGNITESDTAEDILQEGYADLIAVGRGHLCDPSWANKALKGKEPDKCFRCRQCKWYEDGEKCPAVIKRNRKNQF